MSGLFTPWNIGTVQFKHRVVMSPMTRLRNKNYIPTTDVVNYYRQRSSDGGLIISESIAVGAEGTAWPLMPGIWNQEQVKAWKDVTRAVHCQNGKMFAQLFHSGRISHSSILPGNVPPDAPSAVQPKGTTINAYGQRVPFEIPTAMSEPIIKRAIKLYRQAAVNCVQAEFDGIEIHCGDGFLIEQFMHARTNHRTDKYKDPTLFLAEIIDTVKSSVNIPVGLKITPFGIQNDCFTQDYDAVVNLYKRVLNTASALDYVTIVEPKINLESSVLRGSIKESLETSNLLIDQPAASIFKDTWSKTIIGCGSYPATLDQPLLDNTVDAVAYGRWFTSNPTLPDKIKNNIELTPYDTSTFYTGGNQGYTTFI
jgi:N-ethylmaleimide reductase